MWLTKSLSWGCTLIFIGKFHFVENELENLFTYTHLVQSIPTNIPLPFGLTAPTFVCMNNAQKRDEGRKEKESPQEDEEVPALLADIERLQYEILCVHWSTCRIETCILCSLKPSHYKVSNYIKPNSQIRGFKIY